MFRDEHPIGGRQLEARHRRDGQGHVRVRGGDLRNEGAAPINRLRPNGTIVPRNNFVGRPIHRVDTRFTKRFTFSHFRVDLMLEVFNLFDHANFGSYTTVESSASYGQPSANTNVAYQPRMGQIGFRFAF